MSREYHSPLFVCPECRAEYKSPEALGEHIEQHNPGNPVKVQRQNVRIAAPHRTHVQIRFPLPFIGLSETERA